jgi:hypothetical protein
MEGVALQIFGSEESSCSGQVIDSLGFENEAFEAAAPLGDSFSMQLGGSDCEVCCPGSCTGCTQCNKCNLLF